MTQFNKGPTYGLSAEVKSKIAQKYDMQKEEELRYWIEEVTGMPIGDNFQKGLKDGVILCELINKLQPGSVKKINNSQLNWHKLENLGNFIKAILEYGLKPNDIFEANDLFENGNMTQVQTTLLALASMVCFQFLYTHSLSLTGSAGMAAPGTRRDIFDQKVALQPMDSTTISLQMGTNKVASQKGMSVYGLGRQVYDPKYCPATQEPGIHANGSQGTGTNGSEISDSDYQAEYPDEYHGGYQDDYSSHYDNQGVDY
ncbi:calponin-3-like [Arapaima gigas]